MKKRILALLLSVFMFVGILPLNLVSAEKQSPEALSFSVESRIKSYNSPSASYSGFEKYIVDSLLSCQTKINLEKYNFNLDERVTQIKSDKEMDELIHSTYPQLDLQVFADKYIDLYNLNGWVYNVVGEDSGLNYDNDPNNDVPIRYYIKSIEPYYHFTLDQYNDRNNAYKAVAASMVVDLKNSNLTDLEKALILHDRLAIHCEYDYENYQKYIADNNYQIPPDSLNMYGALVNKTAVCQGYAKSYQYMLGLLGIDSRLCVSEELNHMWNIVTIDGVEYHVDVTHDDPVYNIEGRVNHDNFLRSSQSISKNNDYVTDFDMTLQDTRYDRYFWQNSNTAFQYVNGNIYYIDNKTSDLILWNGKRRDCVLDIHNRQDSTIRLNSYRNNLYYTFNNVLWGMDISEANPSAHAVYTPKFPLGYYMYGFNIVNGEFWLESYKNPNGGTAYVIKERVEEEVDISASLSNALLRAKKSFNYDGNAKTLNINASHNGIMLYDSRDYIAVYKSNINAGTATVTLTAQNGYKGTATATFTILPKTLAGVKIAAISDKIYTGSAIKPTPLVTLNGKYLQPNVDFTVGYSSNVATGRAEVKIVGKGNYSGAATQYFYIHPQKVTGLKFSSATAKSVKIKWSKSPSGTGYAVRRKTSKKGSFKTIAVINSVNTTSYTDKNVKANKTYYYDVVAFKTVSGKKYGSVASALITAKTATATPKISYYKNSSSKKAKIKWKKVSGATKYKLYMSTQKGTGYKCIYTGTKLTYTKSKLKRGKTYYFKLRTYKTFNGKKLYSSYSSVKKVKIKK